MTPRRANRVDHNHAEIVKVLRGTGILVFDSSAFGGGFTDIVTYWKGVVRLLEIKDGGKSPSRRRLTPAQKEFRAQGWPVIVVENGEEALAAHGVTGGGT